jgi:hypothetical protein
MYINSENEILVGFQSMQKNSRRTSNPSHGFHICDAISTDYGLIKKLTLERSNGLAGLESILFQFSTGSKAMNIFLHVGY